MDAISMINSIAEVAKANNAPVAGDFIGDDGLLHCGKCGAPKECMLNIFGGYKVPCTCKCQQERLKAEDDAKAEAEKQQRIIRLRENCFQTSELKFREWNFDKSDRDGNYDKALTYAQNWEENRKNGIGLLLFGDVGRGKSVLSACIANYVIDNFQAPCRMVNMAWLINGIQNSLDKNGFVEENVSAPALLIIDDYGSQRDTSYANEVVFNIIDSRVNSGKPMILTTNLALSDFKSPVNMTDKRISERILSVCMPISFDGENKRQAAGQRLRNLFRRQLDKGVQDD